PNAPACLLSARTVRRAPLRPTRGPRASGPPSSSVRRAKPALPHWLQGSAAVPAPTRRHHPRRCAGATAASRSRSLCPAPAPSGHGHRPGATRATRPSWPRPKRRPPATDPSLGKRAVRTDARPRHRSAPRPLHHCRRLLRHRAPGTVITPAAAPRTPPRPAAYKYPPTASAIALPYTPHTTLLRPKAASEGNSGAATRPHTDTLHHRRTRFPLHTPSPSKLSPYAYNVEEGIDHDGIGGHNERDTTDI
ncbi:hypothetical protein U9M48_034888, partial [Paspalum notatum var. saurae]